MAAPSLSADGPARLTGPLGGQQNAIDDALVASAPADVAGQRVADLLLVGVRMVPEERGGLHDHARRAEPALEAMRIPHRLLQRAQPPTRLPFPLHGEPLDRRYLAADGLDRQHQARAHRPAVDDDRARAAASVLAAQMGAGETEVIPQEVRQR